MTRKTFWFSEEEGLITDYHGRSIGATRESFEGGGWIQPYIDKHCPTLYVISAIFTKRDIFDCLGWTTGEQEEVCQIELATPLEIELFY